MNLEKEKKKTSLLHRCEYESVTHVMFEQSPCSTVGYLKKH